MLNYLLPIVRMSMREMCVAGSLCMRRLIKVTRRLLSCSSQGVRM